MRETMTSQGFDGEPAGATEAKPIDPLVDPLADSLQFIDGPSGPPSSPGDLHDAASHGLSGTGGSLPHGDRIQESFGRHDVSGLTAHVGGRAKEACDTMGAGGFATKGSVGFADSPDLHTAAHEAAHFVQQQQGVQLLGGVGKKGDPYEQHADQVADAVVQGKSAEGLLDEVSGSGSSSSSALQADVGFEFQTFQSKSGFYRRTTKTKRNGSKYSYVVKDKGHASYADRAIGGSKTMEETSRSLSNVWRKRRTAEPSSSRHLTRSPRCSLMSATKT